MRMKVTVNGKSAEVKDGATVADLLAKFELQPARIAVELNERLVRRAEFASTPLRDGDRLELVTFVGGG